MDTFDSLGIVPELTEKLKERRILKPTTIQQLVIPALLEGKSVLFRSATGTGKTLAYLLPIIQKNFCPLITRISTNYFKNETLVLICAPTLELCFQIEKEINFLLQSSSTVHCSLFTVHCIIGTPGKLLSLIKSGKLKLKTLKTLILDEADRLTAKDCIDNTKELLNIIKRHANKRTLQVIVCSATVNEKTKIKLGELFAAAEIIQSDDNEILRGQIEHWAIFSEKRKHSQTLRSLVAAIFGSTGKSKKNKIKILVFTTRNEDAAIIHSKLLHHKVKAAALFSKLDNKPLSAERRMSELEAFRKGETQVLVATDLAARGLDIQGITHVVAMDVPQEADAYIHRAGRTARAGKRGIMVTIGDEVQMRLLSAMEKKLKIRITPKELYSGQICAIPF